VAGLAGSYLISSAIQEKALKERFAAYNSSIDAQTNNLNIAVKYAKKTCDCYDAAYKKLNASYQKGQVSKEEMLVRLKEIRDGNNDAIKVLEVFKAESVKHTETYAQIYKLEQNRTSDRASKGNLGQLRSKQNGFTKATTSTENTLSLIAKRNSIIENDIRQRETASRGGNILAVRDASADQAIR
jgi:LysM repeat protein